jgi:hypothetical protein
MSWHAIGQTVAERGALFNRCKHVTIWRSCDEAGAMCWETLVGTDTQGGFIHGRDRTRKAAVAHALERYPGLQIDMQHGTVWRRVQDMSPDVAAF